MENQIIQEIELKYKTSPIAISKKLTAVSGVYELLHNHWDMDTINLFEEFKVLYLNRANLLIGICSHSKGGISGTVADVRLIMGMALKCAASGIILAHNHPSGNTNPSQSDLSLTQKISDCCKLFDIVLLDHIIVTEDKYYSFKEEGII